MVCGMLGYFCFRWIMPHRASPSTRQTSKSPKSNMLLMVKVRGTAETACANTICSQTCSVWKPWPTWQILQQLRNKCYCCKHCHLWQYYVISIAVNGNYLINGKPLLWRSTGWKVWWSGLIYLSDNTITGCFVFTSRGEGRCRCQLRCWRWESYLHLSWGTQGEPVTGDAASPYVSQPGVDTLLARAPKSVLPWAVCIIKSDRHHLMSSWCNTSLT